MHSIQSILKLKMEWEYLAKRVDVTINIGTFNTIFQVLSKAEHVRRMCSATALKRVFILTFIYQKQITFDSCYCDISCHFQKFSLGLQFLSSNDILLILFLNFGTCRKT